jgi:shikimate dehydrogenase
MVYGARPTGLVSAARARGARTVDGLAMLIWQAAVAFELWTGAEAPVDVMKRAVGR